MAIRSGYAEGEVCWADLQTSDVAAAKEFYAEIFGWRYEDLPTPDGRSYAKAFLGEELVTVIAPQNPQQQQAARRASGMSISPPTTPPGSPPNCRTPAGRWSSARRPWRTPA